VSDSLQLCDCPGLVFPSVVSSRAEMVVGGILPLNALKDHISPMELLAKRIPRAIFEETYNIVLPSTTAKGEERVYVTWQVCLVSIPAPPPPPLSTLAPCYACAMSLRCMVKRVKGSQR
jgi:hypothetical protein